MKDIFEHASENFGRPGGDFLSCTVEKASSALNAIAGDLSIFDERGKGLALAAGYGLTNFEPSARSGAFPLKVLSRGPSSKYCSGRPGGLTGANSIVSVPLSFGGEILGVFNLYFRGEKKLTVSESDFISMLVNFLSSLMQNRTLSSELGKRHLELAKVLIRVMEEKDRYTKGHSERVKDYALKIGRKIPMSVEDYKTLSEFSILHDIGKITIDSHILNNPGELTEAEWSAVRKHPLVGERILHSAEGFSSCMPIIKHHHERLDGGGYPDGLKGDEISLLARIISVSDSFDAMVSRRAYRKALSAEEAKNELIRNSGSQFDPGIVGVMVGLIDSGELAATARTQLI